MSTTLKTQNEAYGFYGTLANRLTAKGLSRAWDYASDHITGLTDAEPESVRAFLDSSSGRHFADDVINFLDGKATVERAVAEAAARWMGWKIGRKTAAVYGIPKGLPYLTGFVIREGMATDE